jgi:hypothetical protein
MDYGLSGRTSIPGRARDFSLLHSVQTRSGSNPTSPGVKLPGRETDHSLPYSAEFMNGGAIPPLPHASSWRGA